MKFAHRFARPPVHSPAPSINIIDASQITDTLQRAFAAAGLSPASGLAKDTTDTISKALAAAGLTTSRPMRKVEAAPLQGTAQRLDVEHEELPARGRIAKQREPLARPEDETTPSFLRGTFADDAGSRTYRLYVPASYVGGSDERVPLIVMLHGCTQSPEDFAAGTKMNALAEEHGFLVLYPAQAANANGSRCWNWFRAEDQRRDSGEPALLAGLVRQIQTSYRVDPRRVFVTGLSAGAAMAVILGATYPDLFAAVGAHSGLPYGAAHDVPSAFGAMHGGGSPAARGLRNIVAPPTAAHMQPVPTIVFHGDADQTVVASNGARIVQDVIINGPAGVQLSADVNRGTAGRAYTRTVYTDESKRPVVEHWVVHGAGHAWSGGSACGTFTDIDGPDASAEMIRFFFAQRGGTA